METDDKYTHFYVNEKQMQKLGKLYDLIELRYGEKYCVIHTMENMNQSMHRENMNTVEAILTRDVVN